MLMSYGSFCDKFGDKVFKFLGAFSRKTVTSIFQENPVFKVVSSWLDFIRLDNQICTTMDDQSLNKHTITSAFTLLMSMSEFPTASHASQ